MVENVGNNRQFPQRHLGGNNPTDNILAMQSQSSVLRQSKMSEAGSLPNPRDKEPSKTKVIVDKDAGSQKNDT